MNPLDQIEQKYPSIITTMPDRFNSHEFILALANAHQGLYVKVLAQYADGPKPEPFKIAHGKLASRLNNFDTLLTKHQEESSTNILGGTSQAMVWTKK
jgi:hypothetical protein